MRGAEIYISLDTYRRLRAFADIQELNCIDAGAEMLLTESLKAYPQIDELIVEQRRVTATVRDRWKVRQALQNDMRFDLNTQQQPLSQEP